eukprot:Em0002g1363a
MISRYKIMLSMEVSVVRSSDNGKAALTAVGGFAAAVAGTVIAGPVGAVLVVGGAATFLTGWAVGFFGGK